MNRKHNRPVLHLAKHLVPALLSLLLFTFCASDPTQKQATPGGSPAAQNAASKNIAPHWSYTGNTGPAYWHTLDSAYRIAAEGQAQSPINIDTFSLAPAGALGKPVFNYVEDAYELENNGHTIELLPEGTDNHITLDGRDYVLQQFHFHSPSEHRIDGKTFDLELHFVHKDREGNVTVAGVLFNEGSENKILKELFAALEREAPSGKASAEVSGGEAIKLEALNPAELFDVSFSMYRYDGSLTTPPCTEGVKWGVSSRPQELSKAQLAAFKAFYNGNNRPVQALHGRPVYRSE
jgi:carbonic anhydrase